MTKQPVQLEFMGVNAPRYYLEGIKSKKRWNKKSGLEEQLLIKTRAEIEQKKHVRVRANLETYEDFLRESERVYNGNPKKLENIRRELLIKYFPRRFEEGGEQDVSDYDAFKIAGLFKYLVDYAKEQADR